MWVVERKQWLLVETLSVTNKLLGADGTAVTICHIHRSTCHTSSSPTLFNIEVDTNHNYFVASTDEKQLVRNHILVHNAPEYAIKQHRDNQAGRAKQLALEARAMWEVHRESSPQARVTYAVHEAEFVPNDPNDQKIFVKFYNRNAGLGNVPLTILPAMVNHIRLPFLQNANQASLKNPQHAELALGAQGFLSGDLQDMMAEVPYRLTGVYTGVSQPSCPKCKTYLQNYRNPDVPWTVAYIPKD